MASVNKISLTLGARRPLPPTIGVKRPHSTLQDEEDDGEQLGRSETVSHFDRSAGGAIDESTKKKDEGPLVIPTQKNRDWKAASNARKRQKSGLPGGEGVHGPDVERKMKDIEAADLAKKPQFGLNVYSKGEEEDGKGKDERHENGDVEMDRTDEGQPPKPRTDDDLAIDALLGKTSKDPTLTIGQKMSEAEAFEHDFRSAPDMATIAEYTAMPVEQFGAALLRGMGWKDGEGIGSQKGKKLVKDTGKLPERRAALLGIGAKEDKAIAQEMGVWGKNARNGKEVKIYNPVLLKDKKTGELFTEEALQRKREQDEKKKFEDEFERKERRKKRDEGDGNSRDRRRDDGRRRDGERREERPRRDERVNHGRDRRRHDDEESDGAYYCRKEKERRSREASYGDHDREHSRRHRDDSDRDRRRDRERDRRR